MADSTRASLPESDPVSPVPEAVSSERASTNDSSPSSASGAADAHPSPTGGPDGAEAEPSDGALEHLPDPYREAMQRLHRRVEEAATTIERLRTENKRLRQRVEELEAQPQVPDDETVLALDDDPEEVRERITRFIEAIDTYLESTGETDASSPDASRS